MTNNRLDDFLASVNSKYVLSSIDPKAKALIAIAVDLVNGINQSDSNSFASSIHKARSQGITDREIKELLLLLCVYGGFNKVAGCFATINEILSGNGHMISTMRQEDYAIRDRQGKLAFYVLLWKRKGIDRELFYNYWKNVHGPLCAHLPGQHQYWQFHLDRHEGGIWPMVQNVANNCPEEDCFDGIAELTFASQADFQAYIQEFGILMADEHNLFSKAIAYSTNGGNSQTYIDRIPTGEPNGELDLTKFHVMVQKSDVANQSAFRQYMTDTFAPAVVQSDSVIKFRLHLLEPPDNSRPSDDGVCRYEPLDNQYQAAVEIAFANPLEMERFFASSEYAIATQDMAKYVKGFYPFPERSTYTFVYDGKMTLAGKYSSQVADLILQAGATNQLKEDVVALMNGTELKPQASNETKSGLGHYLQGVQHFGVTVDDMAQAVEFYTEVLGGKLVVSEDELVGDKAQNTLFQQEELDAIAAGIDPDKADIPHLRSGTEQALDVKFISFGNVVVELLQIREAKKPSPHKGSVGSRPSHIGEVNAMHLSFNVKEGIDLNLFARMLEEECQRRGMSEVAFNRVIRVNSEPERKAIALKYNSFKFWNEPDDDEPIDWSEDPMEGWSLFYCKGPNGEQLEFNQATRTVKEKFRQGVRDYNQANDTAFIFPEAEVTSEREKLYFTFSSPVNAPVATVWSIVKDKIENTSRYNPEAQNPEILTRYDDGVLRQMNVLGMKVKERILIDEQTKTITHTLLDNPWFTGKIVNQIISGQNPQDLVIDYIFDWLPIDTEGKQMAAKISPNLQQAVRNAVLSAKEVAEEQTRALLTSAYRSKSMLEPLPGKNADLVKRLFSRGEAFDSAGFVTFFTDNPVYQFGNFDVCLDKQAIKQSADNFFSQINAVYHEIKMMQEVGNVVFVEMDVYYWRKDGSTIALPCCDIFRVEGDKFSELRIFMDVNPVFDPSIPVPPSASVLTASQGQTLIPPGTMKRHFAEHPEGKQRVADGYVPKWSIAGPNWEIARDTSASSEQLNATGELANAIVAQDWAKVKTYLTDDIYYKVGSTEPRYGRQEVVDFFAETFKTTAVFTGHKVRKIWQEPDIITIEMDAYYKLVSSGRQVTISCCDIYRMRGNKVSEWRVYADMSPWQESTNGVVPKHTAIAN